MPELLLLQNRLGCGRIVRHEANYAFSLLPRYGLESQNVYFSVGQRPAGFCQSAWLILQVNREFFCLGHLETSLQLEVRRFRRNASALPRNHKPSLFEIKRVGESYNPFSH